MTDETSDDMLEGLQSQEAQDLWSDLSQEPGMTVSAWHLLTQACRLTDNAARLEALAHDAPTMIGSTGQTTISAAWAEARQSRNGAVVALKAVAAMLDAGSGTKTAAAQSLAAARWAKAGVRR